MGIVATYEKAGSASVDIQGHRRYTRKWLVEMANIYDAPPDAWGTGFPAIVRLVSTHPGDAGAVATELECEAAGDALGLFYTVSIKYTSKPFDQGNQTQDPTQTDASVTPTSRPWVIKFGSVHSERVLGPVDYAGVPVVNSANEPFTDPPIMVPTSNQTITVTAFKDISTFDPIAKTIIFQDAINNADLLLAVTPAATTVYPARTLRCTNYECSSVFESGAAFWQCDITLEFKPSGWNPVSVLNAGCHYVKAAGKPPVPIMDETGAKQISKPIPLTAAGGVLTAGGVLNYKQFTGYNEVNMALILT